MVTGNVPIYCNAFQYFETMHRNKWEQWMDTLEHWKINTLELYMKTTLQSYYLICHTHLLPILLLYWLTKHLADMYLLRVNNRNTKTRCEICSKLTIKTPERCCWHRSSVFIVNFEDISHPILAFLFLTWTCNCRLGRVAVISTLSFPLSHLSGKAYFKCPLILFKVLSLLNLLQKSLKIPCETFQLRTFALCFSVSQSLSPSLSILQNFSRPYAENWSNFQEFHKILYYILQISPSGLSLRDLRIMLTSGFTWATNC